MSMPIITGSEIERSQAITDLIQSVALQETAISHILNAEGEKLQAMIALAEGDDPTVTPEQLLETNESVKDLIDSTTELESFLVQKLSLFSYCSKLSFYFQKQKEESNDPLEGAVFELYQGTTLVATATSDTKGIVLFKDILPGNYQLIEKTAPAGYGKDTETHTVVAESALNIKIDNVPAEDFVVYNKLIS